jgi:catechol 2,3-dioxygenase-like lactoylglutathione lyase family enzyme
VGVNHIAVTVKDIQATHRFYTEAMGFELVKVEVNPQNGGFNRHVFYSTGSATDGLIAFWDVSNVPGCESPRTDLNRDLGLEAMMNHFAFQADGPEDMERRKQRLLDFGKDVLEIDHGWIHSIYTEDPDGNVVEFAMLTKPFTKDDAKEALELLRATSPPPAAQKPSIRFHKADATA